MGAVFSNFICDVLVRGFLKYLGFLPRICFGKLFEDQRQIGAPGCNYCGSGRLVLLCASLPELGGCLGMGLGVARMLLGSVVLAGCWAWWRSAVVGLGGVRWLLGSVALTGCWARWRSAAAGLGDAHRLLGLAALGCY